MLKSRLIPVLLLENGRMVRTIQFKQRIDVGHPVTAAKVYNSQGADELVFLDISASRAKRSIFFDVIERVASECFMPLAVGGGIRTLEDIRELLKAGADKVIINTQAIENPQFVKEASQAFGDQCIVVSIDFIRTPLGQYKVVKNGADIPMELDVLEHAQQSVSLGAGEILLTSVQRNGKMEGYDLEIIKQVSTSISAPVIACGGVGNLKHFEDGVKIGKASAVAASSIFHFTDQNLIKTKAYLLNAGVNVRKF